MKTINVWVHASYYSLFYYFDHRQKVINLLLSWRTFKIKQ